LRGIADEDNDNRVLYGKLNAAQKRQNNRDNKRRNRGVIRDKLKADKERNRKHAQANNRGNNRADPYEPEYGDTEYAHKREHLREARCKETGLLKDCGWKALDYDSTNNGHGGYDQDYVHNKHYPRL
jgi:hypothetical protein